MWTILLFCVIALYQHCYGSLNNNTTNHRLHTTLAHYCSTENFLQCPDNVSRNVVSECCTGCSCEPTCGLTGSCCFEEDDRYHLKESGNLKCMFPDTKLAHGLGDHPMYKFMVGPPPNGCSGSGFCNKSDKLIPWKTFYPIFSKEKGINYLNEECANCHGVTDGRKWISRFSLNYLESLMSLDVADIIQFLQKFKSNEAFAYFKHPGDHFEMMASTCSFEMKETCTVENTYDNLPKSILQTGLSYNDIKYGCLSGPYLQFPIYPIFYKNAFCAICDSFQAKDEKCRTNIDRINNIAFTTVIDNKFVSKITGKREYIGKETACKVRTNDDCRETLCPAMQVRDDNGKCVFPTENWLLQYASVYIDVTFPNLAYSVQTFQNMSGSGLLEMFYEKSPWNKCWQIYYIGVRSYDIDGNMQTEFILRLGCRIGAVNPKLFIAGIKRSLSKNWVIQFNKKNIHGYQDFSRYQIFKKGRKNMATFFPLWDTTERLRLNKTCASVYNLTTPNWTILYQNPSYIRFFIIITKVFYCKLVQFKESEYHQNDDCFIVKLNGSDNVLFQFEVQRSRLDSTTISVCLEDAGMRIVSNGEVGLLRFGKNLDKYGLAVSLVLTRLRGF